MDHKRPPARRLRGRRGLGLRAQDAADVGEGRGGDFLVFQRATRIGPSRGICSRSYGRDASGSPPTTPDLYIGDQGLSVIRNATTCVGNAGGCGNAVLRLAGATVAVPTDGVGEVYFSANVAGGVYRYSPADGHVIPVATGFLFVGGTPIP